MATLEPGMYRATVRGVPDQLVMMGDDKYARTMYALGDLGPWYLHSDEDVTDARPLVTLDLEDPTRFAARLRGVIGGGQDFISVAEHIEAQTKSRRMSEPGWFGIVAAGDEMRDNWMHYRIGGDEQWMCPDTTEVATWHDLIAPTLIRDGIEAD